MTPKPTIAAIIAFLTMAAAWSDGAKSQAPGETPPPSVIVDIVHDQDVAPQQTFTGRVQAIDKVTIRARISGFIKRRGFEEGSEVKEGQVLFELEREPYEAAVALAEANLANAEAAEELARQTYDRIKPLTDKGTASVAALDEARAKLSQAKANVQAQKANLTKARLDLDYTIVRSPMDGRTGRATYSVGEFVGPSSEPLVTVVRQDPMYVAFAVPQRVLLDARREGLHSDSLAVRLTLPDGTTYDHEGAITFAEVEGNAGTDTVTVRASVSNPDRFLVDQQLLGVTVVSKRPQKKLVMSQSAVLLDQQGAYVLLVDKDNQVEMRRVELGEQLAPNTVVNSGLKEGDRVIVSGHLKARPGSVVEAHVAKAESEIPVQNQ